jgi:hypothetical protein
VIIEAFLWGLGTALGELPPYFVSRAGKYILDNLEYFNIASLAGKMHEELEEMLDENNTNTQNKSLTLMGRIKLLLYRTLKKHAFIVVTLCASVIRL